MFNITIKNKNSKRLKSSKITEKYYKQLSEIFEEYYKEKFLMKSYQKKEIDNNNDDEHELIAIPLIMKNGEEQIKEINSFDNKRNNLVKEIIIIKEPTLKDESMNTFTNNYLDKKRLLKKSIL